MARRRVAAVVALSCALLLADVGLRPSSASAWCTIDINLAVGTSEYDVYCLETRLRDIGYDPGTIDGLYDAATQSAVFWYQFHNGLVLDGWVGSQTAGALSLWKTTPGGGGGGGGSGGGGGGDGSAVYLTFDDGPSGHTWALLDVLDRYGVKATFFVIGRSAAGKADALQAIVARGHALGNHSWSHSDLSDLSSGGVAEEVDRTSAVIAGAVGDAPNCVRPPYGSTSGGVSEVISSMGMSTELWSIDTNDWQDGASVGSILGHLNDIGGGSVVLMHDGGGDQSATVQAVDQWLAANAGNYDFRPLPGC